MRPVVGISVEPTRVVACAVRGGRTIWAAEAAYAGTDDLARVLAGLAAERPRRAGRASVVLAPGLARLKTVEGLPALRQADLRAHVGLHSRRYFLQNGIPLVTDASPAGTSATLAAAPVPLVEAITGGLAAAGLSCDVIVPAEALGPGTEGLEFAVAAARLRAPALSLLPESARRRAREADARSLLRLAVAAVLCLALAGAAYAGSLVRRERAAAAELARLGPAVDAALALRRDLAAASAALDILGGQPAGPQPVRLLAELARALPDSAFLASARFERDGTVRLTGYAKNAARVLERLERVPGVTRGGAEGPVTREVVAGREWERFTIVFRVQR